MELNSLSISFEYGVLFSIISISSISFTSSEASSELHAITVNRVNVDINKKVSFLILNKFVI